MKAVILAGGLGTRLSEETILKPKPMVEIGGKPILWHILKIYSSFGVNEFIICCGYKGYVIKEYFANYFLHSSDVTFKLHKNNEIEIHNMNSEPWEVTLIDTKLETETGGRLSRVKNYLPNKTFLFTYGDGLADVDINKLIDEHKKSNKLATLTAVKPPGRYGALKLKNNTVESFQEKPEGDNAWINGGFFALEKESIEIIEGDKTSWEIDVLPKLAEAGQLNTYKHEGFWQPMDTLRDKNRLQELWENNKAAWKLWEK